MEKEDIVFDYSKLIGRIIEKFGSRKEFYKHISMSITSMNMRLTNRLKFDQQDILELCFLLDIAISQIPEYFFTAKVMKTQRNKTENRDRALI